MKRILLFSMIAVFFLVLGGYSSGQKLTVMNEASNKSAVSDSLQALKDNPIRFADTLFVSGEYVIVGADSSLYITQSGGNPVIVFKAIDGDAVVITINNSDQLLITGATGGLNIEDFIAAIDSIITVGNITAGSIVTGEVDIRANGLEVILAGSDSTAIHAHGSMRIDSDETGLSAGQTSTSLDIVIDNVGVSAGLHHGIDVSVSEDNTAEIVALGTHTGVTPLMQHIGAFGAVGHALKIMNAGVDTIDVASAFDSAANDSTLFNADNDRIFIGHAAVFDEVQITLNTVASASIFQNTAQTFFFYSTGQGTWTRFFPLDNTDGFLNNGDIEFSTLAGWATAVYDSQTMYWIYIQRTRGNLGTSPIENTIRTLASTQYIWSELGVFEIKSVYADSLDTDRFRVTNASYSLPLWAVPDTVNSGDDAATVKALADTTLNSGQNNYIFCYGDNDYVDDYALFLQPVEFNLDTPDTLIVWVKISETDSCQVDLMLRQRQGTTTVYMDTTLVNPTGFTDNTWTRIAMLFNETGYVAPPQNTLLDLIMKVKIDKGEAVSVTNVIVK